MGKAYSFLNQPIIVWQIFGFIVAYWIFDAVLDSFILHNTDFFTSLITPDSMCLNMRLLTLPIITVFAVVTQWSIYKRKRVEKEREKLILELQTSLMEIKTLRGVLPICSVCKKIRDDAGSWSQMEAYISNHSEAEFSHGYCPECAIKATEELKQFMARNPGA